MGQGYFPCATILRSFLQPWERRLTQACAAGSGMTSSVSPLLSAHVLPPRPMLLTHLFSISLCGQQCGPKTESQASLEDCISEPLAAPSYQPFPHTGPCSVGHPSGSSEIAAGDAHHLGSDSIADTALTLEGAVHPDADLPQLCFRGRGSPCF